MKILTFRCFNSLNILTIFCLSAVLGMANASGYDTEKHSDKHHEKSHKQKNKQILITRVNVDFSAGELHIYGHNLKSRHGSTMVLLAGDELVTSSVTENQISAYLKPGTVAGDYLLTVRSGKKGKHQDNYALTIGGIGGGIGEKGEPGRDGATGPAGPAGAIGLTGAIGATGPAGPEGATGPAGAQGLTGPAGDKGAAGPVGLQGATGPEGPVGATGAPGSKGDKGSTGAKGATGSVGLTGATGSTGSQGTPGAKGDKGLAGATGPAGDQGVTGLTGPAGSAGATGATGPEGPQGLPGAAGYELLQQTETTLNNQGEEKLTPTCPVGKVAISGGIMETNNPITVSNSKDFNIAAIHPYGISNWRARWFNGSGKTVTVVLYTICING